MHLWKLERPDQYITKTKKIERDSCRLVPCSANIFINIININILSIINPVSIARQLVYYSMLYRYYNRTNVIRAACWHESQEMSVKVIITKSKLIWNRINFDNFSLLSGVFRSSSLLFPIISLYYSLIILH